MIDLHIITDSSASLPTLYTDSRITVVPNRIMLAGKTYREGIDIAHEDVLRAMSRTKATLKVTPPSESDYIKAYAQATRGSTAVLSIHTSREMTQNWYNARKAAQPLMANAHLAVIDSRTICAAQGLLVETALSLAQELTSFDELVRRVRGAVDRLYSIYYSESLDSLVQSNVLSASHSILGSMLGIKPFLAVENGIIQPIEKVRTRAQAIDRIVEFSIEFDNIERAVIVHSKAALSETVRLLHERLKTEFAGRDFPISVYTPTLAAMIGPDAHGFTILEREDDYHDSADD